MVSVTRSVIAAAFVISLNHNPRLRPLTIRTYPWRRYRPEQVLPRL